MFSGSFGVRSIVLCKCSGKYIDIYFKLKITCSTFSSSFCSFFFFRVHSSLPPPPPLSSPAFFGFLLLSFSSLSHLSSFFFSSSFSLLFSGPTVFSFVSFSPLPSSSGASVVSFLGLFLLYHRFLPFLLLSLSCLFLRPPFLLLFSFFGFYFPFGLSLFFFRFPFSCFSVFGLFGLVFRFFLLLSFLSLSLLVSLFFRSVIRFSFLLASPFLSPLPFLLVYCLFFFFFSPPFLYPSTVRLSFASGSFSLVSPFYPFLRLQPLQS